MYDLTGKTALITGASSGFGAYFATVLASAGAGLVLAARRVEALEAVAETVRVKGIRVVTSKLDVAESASIASAANAIAGRYSPQ